MTVLQTLDRGVHALMLIANAPEGLSVAALAERLSVDRAIAYRIASTLAHRGMVARHSGGRLFLGAGVLALEGRFAPQFRHLAKPYLDRLAQDTVATAFISVAEGADCVAVLVSEPEGTLLRVGYRTGRRHPVTQGAAGIAILAGRPENPEDDPVVRQARIDGYSVTRGALQKGAVGVASPIRFEEQAGAGFEACVGVVAMEDLDVEKSVPLVLDCAQALSGFFAAQD